MWLQKYKLSILKVILVTMRCHLSIIQGVLIFSCLLGTGKMWAQMRASDHVLGDFLVQIRGDSHPAQLFQGLSTHESDLVLQDWELLSARSNIWRVHFDINPVEEMAILRIIEQWPHVILAQFNHHIHDRLTPDDPQFSTQWHHNQFSDKDIDSPEAWEWTTGGNTSGGQRIVVAVLETNGSNFNHTDLIDNHWTNSGEVDGNGIDDDGNGYIDDFNGWNSGAGNDNISAGGHGTAVSGMIGATGNNGNGGVGVNWDVDIMQIQLASLTEAAVISAYSYAHEMRLLYNESEGESGAFVVATNASWGIDGANPSSFPLWCAFYNDLGEAGILNCGATANNNVNVDVVGDMPTGCTSPFMVAVTASNFNDIRTFSGYGTTSIDLAAPGESVYLPTGSNAYASTSGTSFASPCVAGAIALMYSAPCTGLGDAAIADPEGVALMIRDAIFEGVDPVANLADEVATGGRLNVNNSLGLVLESCGLFTGFGCTNPEACNYDPDAIEDDGSCSELDACGDCGGDNSSCSGCTDEEACNYDDAATIGDDSCVYPTLNLPCECDLFLELSASLGAGQEWTQSYEWSGALEEFTVNLTFSSPSGATSSWASDLILLIESPDGQCFEVGGYNMTFGCSETASFPASWNSSSTSTNYMASFDLSPPMTGTGTWAVSLMNGWSVSSTVLYDVGLMIDGPCEVIDPVTGCTDEAACNFNPEANIDDQSCEFDSCAIEGCTYELAENFDPTATSDDGSCVFDQNCESSCAADIDGDGIVAISDLLWLLAEFSNTCPE